MGSLVAVIIPRAGVARTEVVRAAWAPWLAAVPDEPPDGRAENYDEEDHEIDSVFAHAISRSAYYRTVNRIHCPHIPALLSILGGVATKRRWRGSRDA